MGKNKHTSRERESNVMLRIYSAGGGRWAFATHTTEMIWYYKHFIPAYRQRQQQLDNDDNDDYDDDDGSTGWNFSEWNSSIKCLHKMTHVKHYGFS